MRVDDCFVYKEMDESMVDDTRSISKNGEIESLSG
jgi:hypothetical protein